MEITAGITSGGVVTLSIMGGGKPAKAGSQIFMDVESDSGAASISPERQIDSLAAVILSCCNGNGEKYLYKPPVRDNGGGWREAGWRGWRGWRGAG